jgi:hypothetical protein
MLSVSSIPTISTLDQHGIDTRRPQGRGLPLVQQPAAAAAPSHLILQGVPTIGTQVRRTLSLRKFGAPFGQ